ncbi:hypothetical protein TVAG_376260 [Trichomonas vaginalis G3]|uniref:Right handed beta helix domain-containing protein n=1 Tax=Trichomonas vaginalis (strain ATCC PRA-98 / G3) TaxID=412133 RepID=A2FWZ3_TRIV3|nr:hypothetical protein TVAGG3_0740870 [Trichomonas vaginalis G3]EAX90570.1 hypothetical protein TVAG_376260 [Trichomonas vaginalis G3]KAI5511875.1 hypothetical protein TVAGG3_0740870 [Trichomonas vaginalis G3]|eukprot:XP_001303500.1 hypothetical protein [Trichomonas vaginalis G3]
MQLHQSFSDYYGTVETFNKTINETIWGNGNYYIHDAIFSFHYQNTAIYLDSSSKVLLETCTFYNNSSTQNGGSFYIENSDCFLVHICILLSSIVSGSLGGCGYEIYSVENSNNKSYAFESSISQCNGHHASFYHFHGDIKVSNMNTSYHNEITWFAAYIMQDPTGTGIINFTTASNISSPNAGMANSGDLNITKCNYLNNDCRKSNSIFSLYGSVTYSSCSFIGNKGNYLFENKPTIDNCYFNNNNVTQTIYNNADTFDSIEPLDSFISHYSTYYCIAAEIKENKDDTFKKYKEEKFKMKNIKNIVNKVYRTPFLGAVNLSVLK